MTERPTEDRFFREEPAGAAEPLPPPPRRRSPAILARNPTFAAIMLAVCGWLLWDLSSDVVFFLSSHQPIDLGGPGAYRLDLARENRLAQIRGELAEAVPVTEARTGSPRTVGRLAGTNLVVDRPGRGGPPVFEGRLLPAKARGDYADTVAILRQRGAALGDAFAVLRDGERPRTRWGPVAGFALVAALAVVNLRALAKRLTA
ncbi:MAG TPA: hypothetical protein VFK90_09945 [Anaeromyxobacter sp.]|nr:hypothetical protein [Anaeromyxobacter sp.]